MSKYYYAINCTEMKYRDICAIIENSRDITRETFLKHVDKDDLIELSNTLGYSTNGKGMRLSQDICVQYQKSKWKGYIIYILRHSCIEYIFTERINYAK